MCDRRIGSVSTVIMFTEFDSTSSFVIHTDCLMRFTRFLLVRFFDAILSTFEPNLAGLLKALDRPTPPGQNRFQIKCIADKPLLFLETGMPRRLEPEVNQIHAMIGQFGKFDQLLKVLERMLYYSSFANFMYSQLSTSECQSPFKTTYILKQFFDQDKKLCPSVA